MPNTTTNSLIEVLDRTPLLPAGQLQEVKRWHKKFVHSQALGQELVRRGWLTLYQTRLLLAGRASELVLGPYLLLDRIGKGGFSQVFKANHQKLNRLVAVKILRPELAKDQEVVQRFYREIEVASQLSHPQIVHAHEAGLINGKLVLVMEYVEGRDLEEMVRQTGPLPLHQACDYLRQAANGLQYAHERGMIHRDIKPSNLLVREALGAQGGPSPWGMIKILDLGLARLQEPVQGSTTSNLTILGSASVMQGSPDYMSPEQALDFHSADNRADIYSLGCTFFFMLTGKPPFAGGSLAEKLLKHQQAAPPIEELSHVPPELSAIVKRMLAKRPIDRFQTPGEIALQLQSYGMDGAAGSQKNVATVSELQGENAQSGTVWDRISRRRRPVIDRRRAAWAFVFVSLLLFFIVGRSFLNDGGSNPVGTSSVGTNPNSSSSVTLPLEVEIAHCSSGKQLTIAELRVGVLLYMDRKYTYTRVSEGLVGSTLIQTANSDKYVKDQIYLKLAVNQVVTVYVGYDCRSTSRPEWLAEAAGWSPSTEHLSSSAEAASIPSFLMYQKNFSAGDIVLPGNQTKGAAGVGSNYVVVIKKPR